jgi:hypothetical protein
MTCLAQVYLYCSGLKSWGRVYCIYQRQRRLPQSRTGGLAFRGYVSCIISSTACDSEKGITYTATKDARLVERKPVLDSAVEASKHDFLIVSVYHFTRGPDNSNG